MEFKCSCPFYGRSEDECDVGFGYISPHDVEVIVRHCISRYRDCGRYAELEARRQEGAGDGPLSAVSLGRGEPASTEARRGTSWALALDRDALMTVHHELRTPLTSIRSFAEILLQYPIEDLDAKKKFLRIIHQEAERLGRTVEEWFGTEEKTVARREGETAGRTAQRHAASS